MSRPNTAMCARSAALAAASGVRNLLLITRTFPCLFRRASQAFLLSWVGRTFRHFLFPVDVACRLATATPSPSRHDHPEENDRPPANQGRSRQPQACGCLGSRGGGLRAVLHAPAHARPGSAPGPGPARDHARQPGQAPRRWRLAARPEAWCDIRAGQRAGAHPAARAAAAAGCPATARASSGTMGAVWGWSGAMAGGPSRGGSAPVVCRRGAIAT